MKRYVKFILSLLLLASLTACSTTKVPVEDLKEQAKNSNGTVTSPDVDSNNTNEVITDNENEATGNVNDDDANDLTNDEGDYEYTEDGIISPNEAKRLIQETSNQVVSALKNKDMEALAEYVHPEQGVRFTLYSFVNRDDDVVFDKDKIKNLFMDETEYTWGFFDGSGDVVKLTPAAYYEEYVYGKDFAMADQIGYNTLLSGGNTLNNQFEVYDNPIIVEYYFPGFDKKYEGLDWQSLSLVFETHSDGNWYLVGIIHNRMTV